MAQSNGDEKLRKQIAICISLYDENTCITHDDESDCCGFKTDHNIAAGKIMELVLADRKQHELEARLSVIDNLLDTFEDWGEERAAELVRDHYAERDALKAERERLGK